jgi:ribosome-associated protein
MLDDRPLNLTQALKIGGCVQSGGEAKMLIADGQITVNGQPELRKRCKLKAGDTISVAGGPTLVIRAAVAANEPTTGTSIAANGQSVEPGIPGSNALEVGE